MITLKRNNKIHLKSYASDFRQKYLGLQIIGICNYSTSDVNALKTRNVKFQSNICDPVDITPDKNSSNHEAVSTKIAELTKKIEVLKLEEIRLKSTLSKALAKEHPLISDDMYTYVLGASCAILICIVGYKIYQNWGLRISQECLSSENGSFAKEFNSASAEEPYLKAVVTQLNISSKNIGGSEYIPYKGSLRLIDQTLYLNKVRFEDDMFFFLEVINNNPQSFSITTEQLLHLQANYNISILFSALNELIV